MAMVASPANPTGTLVTPEETAALAAACREKGGMLLMDEIYHGLTYEGPEHSVLEFTDRAFVLNGFSKAFAMTGWRIGYLVAPREFMPALAAAHGNFFISTNEFVQWAALAALREAQRMTPALVMRDPYILDFLGLRDTWQEGDLEAAIIREMEAFLLELGAGFSFVARQKRIPVDDDDFHLDLLFYNRKLRRLVAVELKIGEFKAAYKGQMELYLRWLDKHERAPGEGAPIGLILCADADAEQVELLQLDAKSIRVSEYLTALPPLSLLRQRLHEAIEHAREQAARRLPAAEGGA